MNILILGSGARENVLREKLLANVNHTNSVFVEALSKKETIDFIKNNSIELVIPSSEHYLCDGYTDYINKFSPECKVFGPNQLQSHIEANKNYSKTLMKIQGLPNADYTFFQSKNKCMDYFNSYNVDPNKIVLKYSGLAKGKGVYLPNENNINSCIENAYNHGSEGVLIEERLVGTEVSIMAFCNGTRAYLMPQSQDFKRKCDNDQGLNTGGMGSICPVNILSIEECEQVNEYMNKIVKHITYIGVLYAGIMKTSDGIQFLEFNCRFGDPEAQTLLNLLESNLLDIMLKCIHRESMEIVWKNEYSSCVIYSNEAYPEFAYPLSKLTYKNKLDTNIRIYKGSLTDKDESHGGRILSVVSNSRVSQYDSLINVYNNIHKIKFPGSYYRRDIGLNYLLQSKPMEYMPMAIMATNNGTSIGTLLENRETRNAIKIIFTNNTNGSIIQTALRYKIPLLVIDTKKINYESLTNILRQFRVKLLILSGYMRIVPKVLFDDFLTVNIHPSLLPEYGKKMDLEVHRSVLEDKRKFSGCTIHEVTENVDEGRILLQKQINIEHISSPEQLKSEIQTQEKQAIYEFVELINSSNGIEHKYEVNIEEANNFVSELKTKLPSIGGFCGTYKYDENTTLVGSADGVGTKLDLAIKYNKLDTIGIDLIAMNVNDIIAGGGIPLLFMDYIAIDKMDKTVCNVLLDGIIQGCKMANIELIGGETAEMKGIYLKNKLDLGGFCMGKLKYELPKPQKMKPGNILYGIASNGIHSNGYTLVRDIIGDDSSYIDEIMKPTRIYNEVINLLETYHEDILGIAHITGGGFKDNIERLLPHGLGFQLEPWELPNIFQYLQKKGNLSLENMKDVFNCGYGMVIIAQEEITGLKRIGHLINNK